MSPGRLGFLRIAVAVVCIASWLSTAANRASATNYSFVPGDAFFSATLTQEFIDSLPPGDQPIEFNYRYPTSGYFCGYAGFDVLRLEGKTGEFKSRLAAVYAKLRETHPATYFSIEEPDGAEKQREANGFAVFVYNRDIDWTKQRLGIRYNENWFNPPESALHSADRGAYKAEYPRHYDTFVETVEGVAEDWRNSNTYPGLSVGVPENVGWGVAGDRLRTPVRARAAEVQLIIVSQKQDLQRLFEKDDGSAFVAIDSDGIRTVTWRDHQPESINGQKKTSPLQQKDRASSCGESVISSK